MESKKTKGILALILVLVVLILCGIAYVYAVTDVLKSPEKLFKKYLANNVKELKETNIKPLDELFKRSQKEKTEFNFDMDVKSDETTISSNAKVKTDVQNKKEHAKISVYDKSNEYFNLEFLLSNETLGIQIDELHEKYLSLEKRDLKKIARTLGLDEATVEEIPDKLDFLETDYSQEDIEKMKELQDKYMKKINEKISSDKYKAEKKVTTEVNGEEVIANKYTLTLTTKEIAKIENEIFTELFDDPEFIEIYEKTIDKDQIEELKEDIIITENQIEDLKDADVNISVYEVNSKTVKTEIVCEESEIEFVINNKENESTILLTITSSEIEDEDIEETIKITLNHRYEKEIGTTTLEIENIYNKEDVEQSYYPEDYEDENYKIILTTEKKDKNNIFINIQLDDINKLMEDIEISKCELSYEFDENIEIEDFSETNALVLNDYSKEEFATLFGEIIKNASESYSKNQNSLIGMLVRYYMVMSSLSSVTPNTNY